MVQHRLIIGAGIHGREGWMTLDAEARPHTDFVASIPPFPDRVKQIQWDEIEWIHGITSLYPWDAMRAVREIRDMLAPGGRLTLEQPDFHKAMLRVEWVFGDPSHVNPLLMNRWAYTRETLMQLLQEAGFSEFQVMTAKHHVPERDFRIEARK